MPKIRKNTSKRVTLRKKYSVDKKVKEHKRKIKKETKKLKAAGLTHKRQSKNVGIPNMYPYKEAMMDAMERKENIAKEMRDQV